MFKKYLKSFFENNELKVEQYHLINFSKIKFTKWIYLPIFGSFIFCFIFWNFFLVKIKENKKIAFKINQIVISILMPTFIIFIFFILFITITFLISLNQIIILSVSIVLLLLNLLAYLMYLLFLKEMKLINKKYKSNLEFNYQDEEIKIIINRIKNKKSSKISIDFFDKNADKYNEVDENIDFFNDNKGFILIQQIVTVFWIFNYSVFCSLLIQKTKDFLSNKIVKKIDAILLINTIITWMIWILFLFFLVIINVESLNFLENYTYKYNLQSFNALYIALFFVFFALFSILRGLVIKKVVFKIVYENLNMNDKM
ncbi:hypothetical protein [Mesomycoplasma lagogenitalium]|uniref:Uncharacterized protein n=1 Tax=Mesomycoplasma lagogenitalium TaxID=171286 RepID=A0ABY8LTU4_9BACT|nr:hypothetical protein [Mesomycoplasma lagogenitalium]WGI36665.1 hypothetical protein QEG99_00035 [Mesomycoplasma lagogenitalium]